MDRFSLFYSILGIPMTETDKIPHFVPSKGLSESEAKTLLAKHGRNELPEKKKPKVSNSSILKENIFVSHKIS